MSTVADLLRILFVALFSRTRELLKGEATMEEITRAARAVLNSMNVQSAPFGWDDAEPMSVGAARWRENINRPIRLICYVTEVHDPAVIKVPLDDDGAFEYVETTAAKVTGVDGDELQMLDVVGRSLIEQVQNACRDGGLVECLGFVVVLPTKMSAKRMDSELGLAGRFFFHLVAIRSSRSAFDLVCATADERARYQVALSDLVAKGTAPFALIRESLIRNLGIVGRDISDHLMRVLDFVILQAVSLGSVGHAPARLHALVPGPPGHGKKLASLAGRVLNPVCHEASASKVTPAGLVGASYRTADGWRSSPGLLPLASSGLLSVQDAHGWSRGRMAQIAPILQELIEDGEVRDSVAGGRKRSARTALLIDLNRHAHLQVGSRRVESEAPLLCVLPLLSRFDAIIEIPVDAERAWAIGERLYAGLNQGTAPLDHQDWVRALRLLVAALKDAYPVIDTKPVVPLLESLHRDIRAEHADLIQGSPLEASAIPARMAISLTRFVIASSRAHGRSYATADDVQIAAGFAREKLAFLRTLARSLDVQMAASPTERAATREVYYRERWAGQEARPVDVAQAYAEATGEAVSDKTVKRDLERLGARRVRHGVYVIPSTADGEKS